MAAKRVRFSKGWHDEFQLDNPGYLVWQEASKFAKVHFFSIQFRTAARNASCDIFGEWWCIFFNKT